jgi:two-component system sensor kinase FixL
MPQGGALTVEGRQAGDRVEVAVRDTGVGIAPELLSRVTDPLYSTKARGLGLAIARAILEKNDGSLRVASEVGHGSTFTVLLRAAPQEKVS